MVFCSMSSFVLYSVLEIKVGSIGNLYFRYLDFKLICYWVFNNKCIQEEFRWWSPPCVWVDLLSLLKLFFLTVTSDLYKLTLRFCFCSSLIFTSSYYVFLSCIFNMLILFFLSSIFHLIWSVDRIWSLTLGFDPFSWCPDVRD